MPMPSTSMQAASCRVEEPTPISESRRMPRVVTVEPAMTSAPAKSRSAPAITSRGNSGSAAVLDAAVLVAGILGGILHTGLFFVPALAAMAVAGVKLWREQS